MYKAMNINKKFTQLLWYNIQQNMQNNNSTTDKSFHKAGNVCMFIQVCVYIMFMYIYLVACTTKFYLEVYDSFWSEELWQSMLLCTSVLLFFCFFSFTECMHFETCVCGKHICMESHSFIQEEVKLHLCLWSKHDVSV